MAQGAQQQQGGGGGGDNAYSSVWIAIFLMVVVIVIWYKFHTQIAAIIFSIKLFQARFISLFTSSIDPVMEVLETVNPASVTWAMVEEVSRLVGNYMRYPIAAALFSCAALLYTSNPLSRFRKTYSMNSLVNQERHNWKQTSPVIKLELIKQDIDKGPWAMALTPMMFAQKLKLLKRNPRVRGNEGGPFAPSPLMVIRPEAKKAFNLQMGDYWQGPEALPPHLRALFAAFAAKMNRDGPACAKLLESINDSTYNGKIDFTGYMDLLKKHYDTKPVIKVLQRHAYVSTILGEMLVQARTDGVMATADFLWLKPIDRGMWYMLNSMGRQTPYVEAAGPFAHWLAEKEIGHRIMVPVIDEAVNALELAVADTKLTADELASLDNMLKRD